MAEATTTKLDVKSRSADGSRAVRRLRRSGRVPGVLYGHGGDAVSFDADARELRLALARSGAVLDLSVDGKRATPVVLKESQRDPVRGETIGLAAVAIPEGVTLLDDIEDTVVATLSPPRLQAEVEEEIEAETELVGEGEEPAEGAEDAEASGGGEASSSGGGE